MKRTFLLALSLLAGCGDRDPAPTAPGAADSLDPAAQDGLYRDVTRSCGLDFVHHHGGSGAKYLVETNGSGAAWLDHDGDGQLDLYLVQGAPLPGCPDPGPWPNELWRQSNGHFENVTDRARVGDTQHGMAAAAPDVDNDGDADLFVTNFGTNVLYRNGGDGVFDDVSSEAGVADSDAYHASCLFADLDRDGDLDLYVVGYLDWSLDKHPYCGNPETGLRTYCHPDMFQGVDDLLYRNEGDGTFTNVSAAAGLEGSHGKGLGVAATDVDRDGLLDIFVANDSTENLMWRNEGGLRLRNLASEWGVDYNGKGTTEACMGCDFADVDGDLDFDLFTVNLSGETNTLWTFQDGHFRDRTVQSGLAMVSESFVGFGTLLADVDRDGNIDVVVANGHVLDNAARIDPKLSHAQTPHLLRGLGAGRFELMPVAEAGAYFGEQNVGRALAAADYDDDGDLDLLFTNNNGRAHLLENRGQGAWLGLELEGTRSCRDAIGTEVTVRGSRRTWFTQVRATASYLSYHDRRVLVGLGDDPGPFEVELRWSSGQRQALGPLEAGRYHAIREPE